MEQTVMLELSEGFFRCGCSLVACVCLAEHGATEATLDGFDDGLTRDMGEALKANTTLTDLRLFIADWGAGGVQQLAEALKVNCSLTRITLVTVMPLSSTDQQRLLEALQVSSSIKRVVLQKIVSTAGASHLEELFRRSATITALWLIQCKLGGAAIHLAEGLRTNTTLTEIAFASNLFRLGDYLHLAGALAVNKALRHLAFRNLATVAQVDMDLEAAQQLASALKVNQTLVNLALANVGLCPLGVKAISDAFQPNRTLRSLDLMSNEIGSSGGGLLVEALRFNRHLTELNLAENRIEDSDLTVIQSHLEKSKNPPLVLTARVKRAADESAVHMHFRKMSAEVASDAEGQEAHIPNLTFVLSLSTPVLPEFLASGPMPVALRKTQKGCYDCHAVGRVQVHLTLTRVVSMKGLKDMVEAGRLRVSLFFVLLQ